MIVTNSSMFHTIRIDSAKYSYDQDELLKLNLVNSSEVIQEVQGYECFLNRNNFF